MKIENAKSDEDGLWVELDGHLTSIRSKRLWLDVGVVVFSQGDLHWERAGQVMVGPIPERQLDATGLHGTMHPVLVVMARRDWTARDSFDYRAGPVAIPTIEEARAELADPPAGWAPPLEPEP